MTGCFSLRIVSASASTKDRDELSKAPFPPFAPFALKGVAEATIHCAHRTSTASSCAFCEQKGHLAAPSSFGVRPTGLVNRKDPLSLDGFEGSGADFPGRYKPFLHDANTIVTSPHMSLSMFSLEMERTHPKIR